MKYDAAEQAALYAAGALPEKETAAFEALLDAGDETAVAEWRRVTPAFNALCDGPEVYPPPRIRDAVIARIANVEAPPNGVAIERSSQADWIQTGRPGLWKRPLSVGRDGAASIYLLRVEPGSAVPAHPHPEREYCLVLEGSFATAGVVLYAGDAIRFDAGTHHAESVTSKGCLLLISTGAR